MTTGLIDLNYYKYKKDILDNKLKNKEITKQEYDDSLKWIELQEISRISPNYMDELDVLNQDASNRFRAIRDDLIQHFYLDELAKRYVTLIPNEIQALKDAQNIIMIQNAVEDIDRAVEKFEYAYLHRGIQADSDGKW